MPIQLSLVLLTLNEEDSIATTLRSLAMQSTRDFEVIVVDAASTDATTTIVRAAQAGFPVPLTLDVAATKIPIGEARNRGVELSRAPIVAFLSADAEPATDWVERAIAACSTYDMAFGLQLHAPHQWTTAAAVRGLRYHYPAGPTEDAARYASNVAGAYRKNLLERFPFDSWANAAEDLLLAKRAVAAGAIATYDPLMVVRHHDVVHVREEWRKSVREGDGWGTYRADLGLMPLVLVWGAALLVSALLVIARPVPGLALFTVVLWAPALRRAWRRRNAMPARALAKGVLASPPFDLAFLSTYLRALARGSTSHETIPTPSTPPETLA